MDDSKIGTTNNVQIDDKMTNFLVRNIFGHEPCHDFNPTGTVVRLLSLTSRLESLFERSVEIKRKADDDVGETSGDEDETTGEQSSNRGNPRHRIEQPGLARPMLGGAFNVSDEVGKEDIDDAEHFFGDDADTTEIGKSSDKIYNIIKNYDNLEDGSTIQAINDNYIILSRITPLNHVIGNDYVNFLKKFSNSLNPEYLNASANIYATRGQSTSIRKAISGIQCITECTEYIRMLVFSHLYLEEPDVSGDFKMVDPLTSTQVGDNINEIINESVLAETAETAGGGAVQVHRPQMIEAPIYKQQSWTPNPGNVKTLETQEKPNLKIEVVKPQEVVSDDNDSILQKQYMHLNIVLDHLLTTFDDIIKSGDFSPETSSLGATESLNVINFYKDMFNYYITNINNTLPTYSINNSYFVKDALFVYFVNYFGNDNTEEKITNLNTEAKNNIFSEIFNLRVPLGSNEEPFEILPQNQEQEQNATENSIKGGLKGNKIIRSTQPTLTMKLNEYIKDMGSGISFNDTDIFLSESLIYNNSDTESKKTEMLTNITTSIQTKIMANFIEENGLFVKIQNITYLDTSPSQNGKYSLNSNLHNILFAESTGLIPKTTAYMINYLTNTMHKLTSSWKRHRGNWKNDIKTNMNIIYNGGVGKIRGEVNKFKHIKMTGDAGLVGNSLSPSSQKIINLVLQKACQKVNNITTPEASSDNNPARALTDTREASQNGQIFKLQKKIIDKVAFGGSPSGIDELLFVGFDNFVKNSQILNNSAAYFLAAKDWRNIHAMYKEGVISVVNNAMVTLLPGTHKDKIVNNMKLTDQLKRPDIKGKYRQDVNKDTRTFQVVCPLSSIMDSMRSFGSCAASTTQANYKSEPLNISIETDGDGNSTKFAFTMSLFRNNKTGITSLIYTLQHGDFVLDRVQINVVIKGGIVNTLSANNTFGQVLTKLESIANQSGFGKINWNSVLDNETHIKDIMRALSQKFMGDFGQELNVIVNNCGQGTVKCSTNEKQLLANGDRPSFVRSCMIMLLAKNGINPNSGVWFMSNNGGIIVKKDNFFGNESSTARGGNNRLTKKTTIQKRKTRKRTTKQKKRTIKKRKQRKQQKKKTRKSHK